MARQVRSEVIDPETSQILHCVQQCVRQAYLCGTDPNTGKSLEHRKEWVRSRMEFLASVFSLDCLTFSVLGNRMHVILRSRPDVLEAWSDEEVARRWLTLFMRRRTDDGSLDTPEEAEIDEIVADKERCSELRRRLGDTSWWMRCLAENIARRANAEDECKGRFWAGRFKAQLILDEPSLLACSAYVDLTSVLTELDGSFSGNACNGAEVRRSDLQNEPESCATDDDSNSTTVGQSATADWERSSKPQQSGWMSPVEITETDSTTDPELEDGGRRPSKKGFLSLSLDRYLRLLEWTRAQVGLPEVGELPPDLEPALSKIDLDPGRWCLLVRMFARIYKRVAGTVESLAAEAKRRNQIRMNAQQDIFAPAES